MNDVPLGPTEDMWEDGVRRRIGEEITRPGAMPDTERMHIADDDPFLKRMRMLWRSKGPPPPTEYLPAWMYEALRRRLVLDRQLPPYRTDEPTWTWRENMVVELMAIPVAGDPKVAFDARGPGVGMHFLTYRVGTALSSCPPGLADKVWWNDIADVELGEDELGMCMLQITSDGSCALWQRGQPTFGPAASEMACRMQALLEAKVVVVEDAKPPRSRTAARKGQPQMDATVRCVTWRQAVGKSAGDGEESARDKHWYVRGHFRNQWYPARGIHRLKYIKTHVKGNREGPLHTPTTSVNVVSR